jgi:hypothetical protein
VRLIHDEIAPRTRSGELARLLVITASALEAEARQLARHIPPLPVLAAMDGIRSVLAEFSGLIPEMVVIGHLLHNGLDEPPRL